MENAKFRVVEFEESDVLTASGAGNKSMHLLITDVKRVDSGDDFWSELTGKKGYLYENSVFEVVGDFFYGNMNYYVPDTGCYDLSTGVYGGINGTTTNWNDASGWFGTPGYEGFLLTPDKMHTPHN